MHTCEHLHVIVLYVLEAQAARFRTSWNDAPPLAIEQAVVPLRAPVSGRRRGSLMVTDKMKLAFSCFCILHMACVSAGYSTGNDVQGARGNLSGGRFQTPQGTGFLKQSRQRPLFARRGQYVRLRIHVPKPNVATVPPDDPPPPTPAVTPKPVKPNCSQLTQSCLPQFGCCDPCASCHCRFFNAICFCRRKTMLCEKNT